jgi:sporulation protein YqfC
LILVFFLFHGIPAAAREKGAAFTGRVSPFGAAFFNISALGGLASDSPPSGDISMGNEVVKVARKWRNKLQEWFVAHTDLPADVIMDLPRVTMIGRLHIYIENHKGVLAFTKEELRLSMKNGQILIKGRDFVLKTILPEEILLEGTIRSVEFIDE